MDVGSNIVDFEIVRRLGESAGTTVWLADHPRHGRCVLRIVPIDGHPVLDRMKAIGDLRHSALPTQVAFGPLETSEAYSAQSREQGPNLAEVRMSLGRPLSAAEAATLLAPIAEALAGIHRLGLSHERLSLRQIRVQATSEGIRPVLLGVHPVSWPHADPVFHDVSQRGPAADVRAVAGIAYWLTSGRGPSGCVYRGEHHLQVADPSWATTLAMWLAGTDAEMTEIHAALSERTTDHVTDIHKIAAHEAEFRLPAEFGGTVPVRFAPLDMITTELSAPRRRWAMGLTLLGLATLSAIGVTLAFS